MQVGRKCIRLNIRLNIRLRIRMNPDQFFNPNESDEVEICGLRIQFKSFWPRIYWDWDALKTFFGLSRIGADTDLGISLRNFFPSLPPYSYLVAATDMYQCLLVYFTQSTFTVLKSLIPFPLMLPHLSLAYVSLISSLISLSSQYFSIISGPSFLLLYSLQTFDLSGLFQSCCISWSVLILMALSNLSSNSSLFPFFAVSHIPPSLTSSIAFLNSFPHFVGFWYKIPLISSFKQIFGNRSLFLHVHDRPYISYCSVL